MRVLISGAGIAGLTAAYWLQRYGFMPTVVERAPSLVTGGYKIDVRGTALQVLRRMGVHDAVVAASTDMQGAMLVDRDGKVVNKVSGYEFRHRTGEDLEIGSRYLVSDPEGPYFKCGIYLWRFNPRDFTTSGPRPGRVRKEQHT
jgi:2-polyprenyl-6-methoxyphenol hydroxylase-like FAD-dependent oxidoreductase